jgi:uncharacterized protein
MIISKVLIADDGSKCAASVFGAVLYHDISNFSWQLFPNHGSHWDPRITGLILVFAAAIVIVIWGPRTLARHRNA